MPQELPQGLRVSSCITEDISISIKEAEHSEAWNTPWTGVGAAAPWLRLLASSLAAQADEGGLLSPRQAQCPEHLSQSHTSVSLIFPRRKKHFEKFLLHPAQNSRLLSAAEVLQAMEDYQGACRHGLHLLPPAPPGNPASWHACFLFPPCSFHFCVFPSCHLMFPSALIHRGGRGKWGITTVPGLPPASPAGDRSPPTSCTSATALSISNAPELSSTLLHPAPAVPLSLGSCFSLGRCLSPLCHTGARNLKSFQEK